MNLPGYSLLYILFLLSMLAMILAGFIMLQFLSRKQTLGWMGRAESECNVNSAITLMRDQSYKIPSDSPIALSLFNGVNDSVTISRCHWGFFDLLKATSRFKNYKFSRMALCGEYHHEEKEAALLLGSSFKPLCICGNTLLKGIFKVPKAGIKAATVAGKFYQRKLLVEGETDATDRVLPPVNPRFTNLQPDNLIMDYTPYSRVVRLKEKIFDDTLVNSFGEQTIILFAKGMIKLEKCLLRGNIMIISDSLIQVEPTAHISDAILCSKNITIRPKFKGTGQFIAMDTLRCGHSCTFPAPSVLAVICRGVNPVPFIFFDNKCLVEGTVLAWSANALRPLSSIGMLREKSRIVGSLYTNCDITLNGEVFGNVIAPGFIFRNPVAIYQNYLVDAIIDYSRQPDYFTGISYNKNNGLLNIIKWLQ